MIIKLQQPPIKQGSESSLLEVVYDLKKRKQRLLLTTTPRLMKKAGFVANMWYQ